MATRTGTARERARAEMADDIKRVAREHLARSGPDLSLRAVARDVGVVSSAVYRYYASRDELLTALIIDAYDSLGAATEAADAAMPARDVTNRWLTVGRAVRAWAVGNRHEYALLYGSPVPGYAAPEDTIRPAARALVVLMNVLREGVERGAIDAPSDRLPRTVRTDIVAIAADPDFAGVPPTVFARAMSVWALLFGTISFELFGQYQNVVTDLDAYFELQLRVMATHLGLLK